MRRRAARVAVSAAVVAAVYAFAIPRIAPYGHVGRELSAVAPGWAAGLAALVVANALTAALPWLATVRGLAPAKALSLSQLSTAAGFLLPGGAPLGMGVSYGILRRLGIARGAAALAVALTGVWSQLAVFAFPVVGLVAVAATEPVSSTVEIAAAGSGAAAVAGVAAGVFVLRRHRPAGLRRRALTAATLANQLTAFVLLLVALRSVGISGGAVSTAEAFLAWSVGRLIGSLPFVAGGVGIVEVGLIGVLVGLGGPHARVVAAVLLFRGLVIVPTLAFGAAAAWGIRRWSR